MRVLIVGSLAGELGTAARIAIARGAKLAQADDGTQALAQLRDAGGIDLVLCDVAHDVAGLVAGLAAERITVSVVACGTAADPEAAVRAIRAGASDYLPLPPDAELIAAMLQTASGDRHIVVARDPVMLATLRRADQIAGAEASVLLTGESGTGKEVLARHIHARSRRAGGPFVAVNCAAIPEALLESELFGHEKGAFSGAIARRIGRFEAAQRGTLLLDEIGELDVRLQAKLLRALQEREIDRVGGSAPVRIDVRILAATNRDLAAEVSVGRFREDLLFRLNVVALRLPPLRERPGDVAALAAHFARRYATLNGLPARALDDAAVQRLLGHRWRGNVRELENVLHRAVLLAEGDTIGEAAIEFDGEQSTPPAPAGQSHPPGVRVGRTLDETERELILQTVRHTAGNRTHAAVLLGISIRALRNKLRDYAAQGCAVPLPASGVATTMAAA